MINIIFIFIINIIILYGVAIMKLWTINLNK